VSYDFTTVDVALETGSVLVACKQGANRTGAFLGMYVSLKADISARDAQEYLRTVRTIVSYDTPGPKLMERHIAVLDEFREWSRRRPCHSRPTQTLPRVLTTKDMIRMANQDLARTMACCSLLQSSRVSLF
jgi:hypothetical protein